jgi:hypothetical protein
LGNLPHTLNDLDVRLRLNGISGRHKTFAGCHSRIARGILPPRPHSSEWEPKSRESLACHGRQLSPSPEKCQIISRYLALTSVGRIISDVGDRTSPAGSTGNLKCAPRPPPGKINLRLSGPPRSRHGLQRGHQGKNGGMGVGAEGRRLGGAEAWRGAAIRKAEEGMSFAMLGSNCPYSTPLGLRLGLLPGPGPAPLGLDLTGGRDTRIRGVYQKKSLYRLTI